MKGLAGFFNAAARPGAARGRPCAGGGVTGCSRQGGHTASCWKVGWEAGQALWDIAFAFLWLQDDKQGQRNALVCPQQPVTSLASL